MGQGQKKKIHTQVKKKRMRRDWEPSKKNEKNSQSYNRNQGASTRHRSRGKKRTNGVLRGEMVIETKKNVQLKR